MAFYCDYCSFRCKTWRQHMRHTFECHSSTPNFSFTCGISGCTQTLKSYGSISAHVRRNHASFETEQELVDAVSVESNLQTENMEIDTPDEEFPTLEETEEEAQSNHMLSAQRNSALLLLNLKERHQLTQSAINFSVGQMKQMVFHLLQDVKMSVKKHVGNDFDIDHFFDVDLFRDLETEHLQNKFYHQHFNLLDPLTVELGSESVVTHSGNKRQLSKRKRTFQYVPLLDSLKLLLSNREVFDEVCQQHNRGDGLIGDICDGELFRKHPLYKDCPQFLQLLVYFDEVEVCNPLAGHAGIHKLGVYYYTIGNLRPELRSTHRSIQLIACVQSPDLKEYGHSKILKHFIKDVNTLHSEGILVKSSGKNHRFFGAVVLLLGDTLAVHELGGFKVGVGLALRICRHCMATKEMAQSKFTEDQFQLRNPDTHNEHLKFLEGPCSSADSTTYGITHNSCLNELPYFHVASLQMPQDVMHTLLEGVLPLNVCVMMTSFINNGIVSVEELNERVKTFKYGRVEAKTKPPRLFEKKSFAGQLHLSGSSEFVRKKFSFNPEFDVYSVIVASQMWNFAIFLPFLIGDKVDENDSRWECFLYLLEITKICTSRLTSTESADYVRALVVEHHQLFRSCYPEVSLTPKMHYMIHFPTLLTNVGPMVTTWCMRMEAKNSYFKRISRIGNFKNLPLSVAKRHQRLLSGYLQGKFFTYDDLESGPCNTINELSQDIKFSEILRKLPGCALNSTVSRPKWISIYGERFYSEEFVLIGFQEDDLPSFGKIRNIMLICGTPLLSIFKFTTLCFNSHLSAYQVMQENHESVVLITELVSRQPYYSHLYVGDCQTYIVMKSNVIKH